MTRFSWSSATLHRLDDVGELDLRRVHAGNDRRLVGVQQVLDHHHRVVALLQRLAVEERRHLGQGQVVVVDGHGGVLLRGAELAADLVVQGGDELFSRHARGPYRCCALRRSRISSSTTIWGSGAASSVSPLRARSISRFTGLTTKKKMTAAMIRKPIASVRKAP